jgi:regulator of replication initiation timing
MSPHDSQSQAAEGRDPLHPGLKNTLESIDSSIKHIQSSLKQVPYEEREQLKKKDEEITFLKAYVKMKHAYDESMEVCTIHFCSFTKCPT